MTALRSSPYRSVTDVNENQWNNVVSQSDRGTMFSRHEWIRAVEEGFDFQPRHVVVEKKGNPVALMPNFARDVPVPDSVEERLPVAQPFKMLVSSYPGYGGPVVTTDERDSLDLLFDTLEESIDGTVLFHRLQTHDLGHIRYGRYLQARGYEPRFDTCLFRIDLDGGWETIHGNMDKERRKDLREAHEQDFRVETAPLSAELDPTYEAYVRNVERVDGTVLPRAFVESIADGFGDRVLVFTAIVDGREVGRYVHLLDDEASVLHHYLSAIADPDDYRYHPSELLHEHAIKFGIERGYDVYGFGRSGSHFRDSVFGFKQKYGGRAIPMFRMEKGYTPLVWPVYKFGRQRIRQQKGP